MNYQIGDIVRVTELLSQDSGHPIHVGDELEVTALRAEGDGEHVFYVRLGDNEKYMMKDSQVELVTRKTNIMTTIIEKAKLAFTPEPEKTFIKAGIMNQDSTLTSDGRELFIEFLFDQHKEEFKTKVVDPILAEEKKAQQ